ncbi:Insulin-like growth factor binding protein, N-terminal [Pseudocohnilembus persalinus]|uniref:Insulin-like growth factor binding protein, N-terminal n=1 Tax=Pseudocohnilembus persalinus TaxID=266149 RepID=A0A0V0QT43_PSEPJ|nr:Insulin-like growth factor binding protein, N-terminal [Pseudocohnilembus persalinus]|eukprot:KRX05539.1 Insulin-like growth factor binding protein, N-terminal [Pseudocohnilembus persalinus]
MNTNPKKQLTILTIFLFIITKTALTLTEKPPNCINFLELVGQNSYEHAPQLQIYINKIELNFSSNQDSTIILVLNQETGEILKEKFYQTSQTDEGVYNVISWIDNNTQKGDLILFTYQGLGSANFYYNFYSHSQINLLWPQNGDEIVISSMLEMVSILSLKNVKRLAYAKADQINMTYCLKECDYKCYSCEESDTSSCLQCSSEDRIEDGVCNCGEGFYSIVGESQCQRLPSECSKQITITSGSDTNNNLLILQLNSNYISIDQPGITLITLDESSFTVQQQQSFDTTSSATAETDFQTAISNLADQQLAIIGFKGQATNYLTITTYTSLQLLGLQQSTPFQDSASFSMIGCKNCASSYSESYVLSAEGYATSNYCAQQECSYKCSECVDENSPNTCVDCSELNRDLPDCDCAQGYYEDPDSKVCLKCHPKCQTCQVTYDNCLICASTMRTPSPFCECPAQYIEYPTIQNECQKCSYKCQSCSDPNNPDICDECVDPNREKPYCNCASGFYGSPDGEEDTNCYSCIDNCAICENDQFCLSCQDELRSSSSLCSCKEGYVEADDGECIQCNVKCKTCNKQDIDECYVCADNRVDAPDCYCDQTQGYFEYNPIQKECYTCDYKCQTCLQSNPSACITCSSSTRNYAPNCDCKENYYDLHKEATCYQCPSTVSNCLWDVSTETVIYECPIGYFYSQDSDKYCEQCVINNCEDPCPVDASDIKEKNCLQCDSLKRHCTKCDRDKFRVLNNNNECICEDYYKENSKGICEPDNNVGSIKAIKSFTNIASQIAQLSIPLFGGALFLNPGLFVSYIFVS